jgi:DNA polymerase-1
VPGIRDGVLLAADYSQIELRILAHLCGDERLCEAFRANHDIHRFTAALILDLKEEEVTPAMRNSAKRVNFGIIYGMSAYGLAKDLAISPEEAQEFIDREDQGRRRYLKKYFAADVEDPLLYHLVVNTSLVSYDAAAELIATAALAATNTAAA